MKALRFVSLPLRPVCVHLRRNEEPLCVRADRLTNKKIKSARFTSTEAARKFRRAGASPSDTPVVSCSFPCCSSPP